MAEKRIPRAAAEKRASWLVMADEYSPPPTPGRRAPACSMLGGRTRR
jgi:hypothetical protein